MRPKLNGFKPILIAADLPQAELWLANPHSKPPPPKQPHSKPQSHNPTFALDSSPQAEQWPENSRRRNRCLTDSPKRSPNVSPQLSTASLNSRPLTSHIDPTNALDSSPQAEQWPENSRRLNRCLTDSPKHSPNESPQLSTASLNSRPLTSHIDPTNALDSSPQAEQWPPNPPTRPQ
jgi:hypothetical protein